MISFRIKHVMDITTSWIGSGLNGYAYLHTLQIEPSLSRISPFGQRELAATPTAFVLCYNIFPIVGQAYCVQSAIVKWDTLGLLLFPSNWKIKCLNCQDDRIAIVASFYLGLNEKCQLDACVCIFCRSRNWSFYYFKQIEPVVNQLMGCQLVISKTDSFSVLLFSAGVTCCSRLPMMQ